MLKYSGFVLDSTKVMVRQESLIQIVLKFCL